MGVCCSDENEEGYERLPEDGSVKKSVQKESRISTRSNHPSQLNVGPETELVQSEKRYLKHLKSLHDDFLVPLFNKKIFPKSKQRLFSNLSIIYKFHGTFLKDLKSSKDIPGVFIKQADFFKIYVQYVENYNLILECLAEFREKPRFVAFTEEMKQKNLHFESLLIEPIQRIPRYELLLKEMIRSTNETDPKHEMLSKALAKVHCVAEKLNERKREFERLARMSYIASRIHGLPKSTQTLYHPRRKFIDEQRMKRRSKYNENEQKPCYCLLFSDVIITTDLSYKFKRLVELSKITTSLLVQRFNGLIFRLDSDPDLVLFCDDLITAEEWIEKVRFTRQRFLAKKNSRLSILTMRSSKLKSFEGSDEEVLQRDTPQKSSPKLLNINSRSETLPILPISSGGFSQPHIVPRKKNTITYGMLDSFHNVEADNQHESSTAAIVQNYDDYDI